MTSPTPSDTIRERNKRKRLLGWVVLYFLLAVLFAVAVFWQAKRVNTLGFAKGTLHLTTSKTKYTVGDPISYTLTNGLSQPITLSNSCPQEPLYVYTWTNNTWVRIHDTATETICASQPKQRSIAAGASFNQSFTDWPHLFNKPGIYRIVELASNYTALPYADFQVVAKPVPPQVQVQTRTQVVIQKVITPIYIPTPSTGGGDSGGGGGDN